MTSEMRLLVARDARLPPLAWCVRLRHGSHVELLCGRSVEVRRDSFFEGAWPGCFESFDFARSADVFGSGGQIVGDDLIIVTPSHTLERVQVIQFHEETLISNSLAFLLTAAGVELDPHHAGYASDFTKIIHHGIDAFDTAIPLRTAAGRRIGGKGPLHARLVYVENIVIDRSGRLSFVEKPPAPHFELLSSTPSCSLML